MDPAKIFLLHFKYVYYINIHHALEFWMPIKFLNYKVVEVNLEGEKDISHMPLGLAYSRLGRLSNLIKRIFLRMKTEGGLTIAH